jgi:hypothetical protein
MCIIVAEIAAFRASILLIVARTPTDVTIRRTHIAAQSLSLPLIPKHIHIQMLLRVRAEIAMFAVVSISRTAESIPEQHHPGAEAGAADMWPHVEFPRMWAALKRGTLQETVLESLRTLHLGAVRRNLQRTAIFVGVLVDVFRTRRIGALPQSPRGRPRIVKKLMQPFGSST